MNALAHWLECALQLCSPCQRFTGNLNVKRTTYCHPALTSAQGEAVWLTNFCWEGLFFTRTFSVCAKAQDIIKEVGKFVLNFTCYLGAYFIARPIFSKMGLIHFSVARFLTDTWNGWELISLYLTTIVSLYSFLKSKHHSLFPELDKFLIAILVWIFYAIVQTSYLTWRCRTELWRIAYFPRLWLALLQGHQ